MLLYFLDFSFLSFSFSFSIQRTVVRYVLEWIIYHVEDNRSRSKRIG